MDGHWSYPPINIFINFPRSSKKATLIRYLYRFSGLRDPAVQTDRNPVTFIHTTGLTKNKKLKKIHVENY